MKESINILQKHIQISCILLLAAACYFPFVNKAIHIDSDMLIHTARQIKENPINPKLGEYGKHMVLHDHTQMPESSVYFRCGHPPLLPMILAGVIAIWGDHEWVVHTTLFIFYLIAIYSVWALLGLFFHPLFQFSITILWTISPSLLVNSHNIMWDVPIAALMLLSFVLFLISLRKNDIKMMFFSGLIAGFAALTKVNALPLYLLCGTYLLTQKKWKLLTLWCIPAIIIPMIWVMHNIIVYHKIHYISIGWFGFKPGDLRFRVERFSAFLGGASLLPLFWLWLMFAKRHYRALLITLIAAASWSSLLIFILKKPLWFGISYTLFASCGLWLFYRSFFFTCTDCPGYQKHERLLIGWYALLYSIILIILPSASVRYMLPMIPISFIVIGEELQSMSKNKAVLFLSSSAIASLIVSITLAIGDYYQCDADRKLPSTLDRNGYPSHKTWYYGRLSFDYYLWQSGYKNLRIGPGTPNPGDYLIDIINPADYKAVTMISRDLTAIPIDTIHFYKWPLRTMGFHGGFYGATRLPYTLKFGKYQKSYCIYQLK